MQNYKWLYGIIALLLTFQLNAATRFTYAYEVTKDDTVIKETEIATVDGDKARIEIRGADGEKKPDTPYLLTLDGGETWITSGIEGDPVCSKINTTEFFREIGALITRLDRLVGADVDPPKVEKVLEEPGPDILGYPTTHIRLVSSVTVRARIFFKKFEYTLEITDELWYTPQIEVHPIERKWFNAMIQTGHEQLDDLLKAQVDKIGGTILKQESLIRLINVIKNEEQERTERATITSIEQLKPDEIPADTFTTTECKNISNKQMKKVAKYLFIPG